MGTEQSSAHEERQGKRGHEDGNVRPADGRYGLHEPEQESIYVRGDATPDEPAGTTDPSEKPARKAAKR